VHAHFIYPTVTDFLWPACEKAGIPFTFIVHGQDIFRYSNDTRNRIGEITASALCLRIFVPSRFHRDYVLERGVPADKIVINPNAIDAALFAAGAIPDRASRQFRSICAVHRLCEKKGLEYLIRAGRELSQDGINIDIYGYGPLEENFRSLIDDLGLENVRLCGEVRGREELQNVFRQYDLFCCPSVRAEDGDMDGIPTSLMEAMAADLPVLTTAVSGIPDLVTDGITGLVCEPTAQSVPDGVRRYYRMPAEQIETMIEAARHRVVDRYDVRRTARVLLRVWQRKTIDIIIVSWIHLEEHREVLKRIYRYTSLPFRLIVSVNSDDEKVMDLLEQYRADHDNFTIVRNGYNAMVGPGTNRALEHGCSDIAVYVCGREGFALQPGWEIPFVLRLEADPLAGLAGPIAYSPSYLTGPEYARALPLFPKFRNREYANLNPDRIFGHVQGGLFAMRRKMYEAIGGFSEEVPHNHTDVEYSFYAESCGWKLVEVPDIVSIYNKTRPPLFARIDESVLAVHPLRLDELQQHDELVAGRLKICNLCGWYGDDFNGPPEQARCPQCGSGRMDRSLYQWLTRGIYLFRRLPGLAVGLDGEMERIWTTHFKGDTYTLPDFFDGIDSGIGKENTAAGLQLAALRNDSGMDVSLELVLAKLALSLKQGGILALQWKNPRLDENMETVAGRYGLKLQDREKYWSLALQYDWNPMYIFAKQ